MPREYLEVHVTIPYTDKNTGNKKSKWNRAGAAFPNKLGGYNIVFDGPVTIVPGLNELLLAAPRPKQDATDFPPRDDQPMEQGGQTYPEET